MKRILALIVTAAILAGSITSAEAGRRWRRDRGVGILDAAIALSVLGLVAQNMRPQYESQSLKDPYRQPYVPGDPLPPRPLK